MNNVFGQVVLALGNEDLLAGETEKVTLSDRRAHFSGADRHPADA